MACDAAFGTEASPYYICEPRIHTPGAALESQSDASYPSSSEGLKTVTDLTPESFSQFFADGGVNDLVLVDYYTDKCGPCKVSL